MRTTNHLAAFPDSPRDPRIAAIVRWLVTAAILGGCGGLEPVAPYSPVTDPAQLFMALGIDHRAVTLATGEGYRELLLTATPLDASGNPLGGLPAPTFKSSDTTRVWVTPDGLLQARRAASNVQVTAEIVAPGNIRQADTIFVNVRSTTAPPVLDVLTLQPADPAAAVLGMVPLPYSIPGQLQFILGPGISFQPDLRVRALDTLGNAITGLAVEYESLNPSVLHAHPRFGVQSMLQPGEAAVVVRATAYGVSRTDTAHFTVTPPVIHGVVVEPDPVTGAPKVAPRRLTIRPGGYVFFTNTTTDSISVTFEDPAAAGQIAEICASVGADHPAMCDAGNIPNFMLGRKIVTADDYFVYARGRQFTARGEYPFRIEPLGVTGAIVVADEVR